MERERRSPGGPRLVVVVAVVGLVLVNGCASAPPRIEGVPGTAPSPAQPWRSPVRSSAVPPAVGLLPSAADEERLARLTLAEVIDLALANSPDTRAVWADAKAAAAQYGADRATRLPTLSADGSAARGNSGAQAGVEAPWTTTYGATLNLTWLLLDGGGRGGRIEASKQALLAANQTQNATLQDRVLQVEVAFYTYAGAKAILAANQISLADAETTLVVAHELHEVGLATVADVLQARTARAQARLEAQETEGQVRTTRGALAVSMGYPAHLPYDIEIGTPAIDPRAVTAGVDSMIGQAVANRPDLEAARVRALAAAARARAVRAEQLPALSLSASTGESWREGEGSDRSSASVLLRFPLFSGSAAQQNLAAARATAEAAAERARSLAQRVIYEVFTAHSELSTAGQRLEAVDELLASATQSEEVARGRYREGTGSILDLLSAQRTLALARAQQINARLAWFTALARLARNAGVLGLHGENPLVPAIPHPEVER